MGGRANFTMQTYLEGLEPVARKPANKRAGAVVEGWTIAYATDEGYALITSSIEDESEE